MTSRDKFEDRPSILLKIKLLDGAFFDAVVLKVGTLESYTLRKCHRLVIAPFQGLVFAFAFSDTVMLFLKII
jgi:hypothetical protein